MMIFLSILVFTAVIILCIIHQITKLAQLCKIFISCKYISIKIVREKLDAHERQVNMK